MPDGVLYVVATPLGNLEDVSARAARVLAEAAVVFAEDTRRTRVLLDHLGAPGPLRSLHEHNERARVAEVVQRLAAGETVALVSDAGTPAVSDPGAALVREVAAAGLRVSPVPGASALTAALSVAGFAAASTDVLFAGFLPAKGAARREALERVAAHRGVVVLFEAPHRLAATLAELAAAEPERPACVCRELTKVHEELRRGPVERLAAQMSGEVKGELTVVLGESARAPRPPDEEAVDAALLRCLKAGLSARDASAAVAAVLQLPRRQVYTRCQRLPGRGGGS